MFDDYKEKVIDAYKKKRQASALSNNLSFPTPAKLKEECLTVYKQRRLVKDEKILRSFFKVADNAVDYGQSIMSCDIDKFRPLLKYLNEKTKYINVKNVELLAWLIDFEPRPFKFEINYKDLKAETASASTDSNEEAEIITILPTASFPNQENPDRSAENRSDKGEEDRSNEEKDYKKPEAPGSALENDQIKKEEITKGNVHISSEVDESIEEVKEPAPHTSALENDKLEENAKKTKASTPGERIANTQKSKNIPVQLQSVTGKIVSLKRIALESKFRKAILSFIIVVATGSIVYLYWRATTEQCMYWTGDHYQPIPCYQKVSDTAVIALDTVQVAHLKKITHPDTLTQNSLGKVWYSKINNVVEFYTSPGFHPIENDRRLRPVTPYILNKYILHK